MEKNIYRYEVGIVQRLAGRSEPGFLGGFKSVEEAFDYIEKYNTSYGVLINSESVPAEEYIAVEEYIEYDDGEEICNRFPIEKKRHIKKVTTYRCEDEDSPYLWRIEYKSGNVDDVWRMVGFPCDDVIDFMSSTASNVTHNVLTAEYETVYRAS
jgi:hypothetical protein